MYILPLLGWDAEARETARRQAQAIMERDPIAGQYLLSQVAREAEAEAEREGYAQPVSGVKEPYDVMRLYARMGRFYSWMSFDVARKMHYQAFAGYVREAKLMQEEEERNRKEPVEGQPGGRHREDVRYLDDPEQAGMHLGQMVQRPQRYVGRVVTPTL